MIPNKQQALELLKKYNSDPFHIKHGLIVSGVMEYFANELGYGDEADFWSVVGLLHDLDFELYPEQHCIKSQELMREEGLDERLIHATASHGYAITVDIKPEHLMEKILYATDELTGLIGAVAGVELRYLFGVEPVAESGVEKMTDLRIDADIVDVGLPRVVDMIDFKDERRHRPWSYAESWSSRRNTGAARAAAGCS